MDASFWISAWEEGRTGFHQTQFNTKLTKYFPTFSPKAKQKVLVPLCGKTKDMIWLKDQGLVVTGVELYQEAVESFFVENNLLPTTEIKDPFTLYHSENITLLVGDFFKLAPSQSYDFIYDRASLVALPQQMRAAYARVISHSLKVGGKYLLVVFEYDQTKLEGPPFSISDDEVRRLYQDEFSIELMESESLATDEGKFQAINSLKQNVYILEKKSAE